MGTPSTPAPNLSKSKLLAFRQCPKRLWLELHRADLQGYSSSTEARFAVGHQVGAIARRIYDPEGRGVTIEVDRRNVARALAQSAALLQERRPIFEAGIAADGAYAFADVLLPSQQSPSGWKMIEVKSSTSVKNHYHDDVAVQAFAARGAGISLESVSLAHIDSKWVYPGDGDYSGLLVEKDLTDVAFGRSEDVEGWISDAQVIAAMEVEPQKASGDHCHAPHACGFLAYCKSGEPRVEFPVSLLPDIRTKALKAAIEEGATDLRDIPDDLLNELQHRVKQHTLRGEMFFDAAGAAAALARHPLPALFLDFETAQFAVPIWKGTRPYQQICFQFSLHAMASDGTLSHRSFLDLTGQDPSRAFAEALIAECGTSGPIFVYNAAFEKTRIAELGGRFPDLSPALLAINARVVDLHPIAKKYYYHPVQQGSWSIKYVTPAIAPDLDYDALNGVKDGGMAMEAFQEAISASTGPERRVEIERQLLAYCALDTLAMVRLWQHFMGRDPAARQPHAETPDGIETTLLALELLRRIPKRPRYTTASELHAQLIDAGIRRELRTIQRQLDLFSQHFDIERDERSKPYRYRWKEHANALAVPMLSNQESLLLMLAEQHLRNLLPAKLMKSMASFFVQARSKLDAPDADKYAREWTKKVRVVRETQPLLPPHIAIGVFAAVTEALYNNLWLDIKYRNATGKVSDAHVMPLGLAQQGPRMYLVCRYRGYDNERTLALHRIVSASASTLTFNRPRSFSLEKFDDEGRFGMGNGVPICLEFKITREAGKHLLESPLSPDQTTSVEGEFMVVRATVMDTRQLQWWIRGFGDQIAHVSQTRLKAA